MPGTLTPVELQAVLARGHLCFSRPLRSWPAAQRAANLMGTLHTVFPGSEASLPERRACRATGCICGQVSHPLRASISLSLGVQEAPRKRSFHHRRFY